MQEERLYFIAIIPPEDLSAIITQYKQDFAKRFNSSRALKVMPHITLKAPFLFPAAQHNVLLKWFNQLRLPTGNFSIDLKDFGAFPNKRSPVVYVRPILIDPLRMLQKELIQSFILRHPTISVHATDLRFTPHITIAYRDLAPAQFTEAWKEYNEKIFDASFSIQTIYLLEYDRREWNIVAECLLSEI